MTRKTSPALIGLTVIFGITITAASEVQADPFGLRNQYRLVSSAALAEVRVDTGLVPAAAPLANSDSNAGSFNGTRTVSEITVVSYYGSLSAMGSGEAQNHPQGGGAFAWIDTATGGAPWAMYQDVWSVTSSTLPVGTPVSITLTEVFTAILAENNPLGHFGFPTPFLSDDVRVLDLDSNAFLWNLHLTSPGAVTQTVQANIGDSLLVTGMLHGFAVAAANVANPPIAASFSFSASAPLFITSVTEGVVIQTASGATYAPTQTGVPEPATLSMLGLGLAALARLRRRR